MKPFVVVSIFLSLLSFVLPVQAEDECAGSPTLVLTTHHDSIAAVQSEQKIWQSYIAEMTRELKRSWFPPRDGRGAEVEFVINFDGTISELRITRSSGFALCDEAVSKAVRDAAPFNGLPGKENRSVLATCKFGLVPNELVCVFLHLEQAMKLIQDGDEALAAHRYSDAIVAYDQLSNWGGLNFIDNRKYLSVLDEYSESLKSNSDARKLLYKALSLDENYAPARLHLNQRILKLGKDPNVFQVRLALARQAQDSSEFEMAIGEYREALRLVNQEPARSELESLQARIDLESQFCWWQNFLKLHPNSAQGHLGLSAILEKMNRLQESEIEYKEAKKIDPLCEKSKKLHGI